MKTDFSKKVQYRFDQYMSRGARAQFAMLFCFIALVVIVVGLIVAAMW